MSRDPAFLFYSNDFLTGVQDLTLEERGQYITLLCLQHQKGHLSEKIIKLSVGNAAADVMAKFRQDSEGLWYNERLQKESEKRAAHAEKQRQRAIDGWKKRKTEETNIPNECHGNATAMPLEDVNVNVNKNLITYKNGGDAWADITSDALFLERLVRIVRDTGATEENVLKATKYFLTLEDAKPNFDLRPRDEVKKHLVNWLNTQKKNVTTY